MSIAPPQSLGKLPQVPPRRRPWLVVGLLVFALAGLVVWRASAPAQNTRVELPVMSQVPPFAFEDQAGAQFGSAALDDTIWVANFIFTRCPNICPRFTAKMAALQDRSAASLPQLKLVSFTVDPEHDVPEVLKAYGEKHRADFSRWTFARGDKPALEKLIKEGMLQPMDWGDGQDLNTVVHGSYFALIDGQRRVRGVYRFTEATAVDDVLRDAKLLLQ